MSQNTPTPLEIIRYAEHFILYGERTAAFKHTFPRTTAKQSTLRTRASYFHRKPDVQKKINEIQKIVTQSATEKTIFTIEQAMKELTENREEGKKVGQVGPMVAATMGKAKIAGLLVDKVEVKDTTTNFEDYMKQRANEE